MDIDTSGQSSADTSQRPKRSRILLSCAPCRHSKLKCDREVPCGQCLKKDRVDLCTYAPKPDKRRPAKGVAARLKRLEGMVREMMDADENVPQSFERSQRLAALVKQASKPTQGESESPTLSSAVEGNVVRADNTTTYVGATHCMAMLEDIEELKGYFDYPDDESEEDAPPGALDDPQMMLLSTTTPRDREYLIAQLPSRPVMDRIVTRYFASMSPSQHVIHRPSFTRAYAKFCQDSSSASYHWLAELFMILAMGLFYNIYQNPAETEADSDVSADERIRRYRSCAGWALVWGKYTQPTFRTIPAFLLYCEAHFALSRAAQMNCYILSGVLMRLMLKMGLHRDPSKLANITPFEGEMRRRLWNMSLQLETIVSFHMGLPSMIAGIEADVDVPKNYMDEDIDEDTKELPPERPHTDFTPLIYPIHKTRILRVFDQIARQVHALKAPAYADVMKLDALLHQTRKTVPEFMLVRPLDECIGDVPALLIQRFGLAALYNKSRCVLHRRYLAEALPKREHDYSRQQCLDGALNLLEFQHIIWEACAPGNILSANAWFVSSLAVHDYLLAAMVLYLVIQNEHYMNEDGEHSWHGPDGRSPSKEELKHLMRRSYDIWLNVSKNTAELRKTADTIAVMLARVGCPVDGAPATIDHAKYSTGGQSSLESASGSSWAPGSETSPSSGYQFMNQTFDDPSLGGGPTAFMIAQAANQAPLSSLPSQELLNGESAFQSLDTDWVPNDGDMDWRFLDVSLASSHTAGLVPEPEMDLSWMRGFPMAGMNGTDLMQPDLWTDPQSHGFDINGLGSTRAS